MGAWVFVGRVLVLWPLDLNFHALFIARSAFLMLYTSDWVSISLGDVFIYYLSDFRASYRREIKLFA